VTLDLDVTSDNIRGSVEFARGSSRAFDGWLELSSLLDHARRPVADQDDPPATAAVAGA
jgi:hypothetical protein